MMPATNRTLFDSHCHLTDRRLIGQIDEVMARARAAGIRRILTVGCSPDDAALAATLADRFEEVFFSAAIHPHDAGTFSPAGLGRITDLLAHAKAVAVGEIGLDYHYDFAPRPAQKLALAEQLALAGRLDLPVILHSREAVGDVLAILAESGLPIRGVFHSFTGTAAEARTIIDAGFCISLSGVVTFKKAGELADVARFIPADRLLVETDAPYLAPEPVRRLKVNEPALLVHTLARVAELRNTTPDELAGQTARNAEQLFALQPERLP